MAANRPPCCNTALVQRSIIGRCGICQSAAAITANMAVRLQNAIEPRHRPLQLLKTALLRKLMQISVNRAEAQLGQLLSQSIIYLSLIHISAEHLTPTVLELGGKSPCIVDCTANLRLAAKRIVFGKYLNCGQTCVCLLYTSRCV